MSEQGRPPRYPLESVAKAMTALDLLRSEPIVRVSDLADRLGVARSTAHRLMSTLVAHGFAVTDDAGQGYASGAALQRLGAAALSRLKVREAAHRSLVALARATGETCELAVLDDTEVLLVDVVEGVHTLRVVDPVGWRAPAHLTAVGRAMLASFPDDELDSLLEQGMLDVATPHTGATWSGLLDQLEQARANGYASTKGQPGELYVGVASAVLAAGRQVVAGIAVAIPVSRATDDVVSAIGPLVSAAARETTERLLDPPAS